MIDITNIDLVEKLRDNGDERPWCEVCEEYPQDGGGLNDVQVRWRNELGLFPTPEGTAKLVCDICLEGMPDQAEFLCAECNDWHGWNGGVCPNATK